MQLPLNDLREGFTVALLNVKLLKDKDVTELKRAVSTLKKTCNAINGDIAGFGDDWLVATPGFAQVFIPQGRRRVKSSSAAKWTFERSEKNSFFF